MLNALSIDVEDYYQVSAFEASVSFDDWSRYESRVERNTRGILDLLEEHRTKATFFVLGWVAKQHPKLIREICGQGHEVSSHGYAHQRIYNQTRPQFRDETRQSKRILEDIIGEPVLGYRAASYSITAKSLWALNVLKEEGFVYDSSIYPVRHDLYGIPGFRRFSHVLDGEFGTGMVEVPLSTVRLAGINFPMAGGGYLRLFPYALTRWGIRRLNLTEQQPAVVYLHPWELDLQQPRIAAPSLARFRHYQNLDKTKSRLVRLLKEFSFHPIRDVLRNQGLIEAPVESESRRHSRSTGTHMR
jgi:polysaccharide deacetylase family protein (PEP-CTERM system associated)